MTDPWTPICLVAQVDLDACAGQMLPAVGLAVFDTLGAVPVFRLGEAELSPQVVYRDGIATIVASDAGAAQHAALAQFWTAQFGAALPDAIDLRQPGASLGTALGGHLIAALRVAQTRSIRLMKELALLRKEADQTQTAFARLESFFYQTGKAERMPDVAFPEQPGQRPILLTKGRPIEQRLPTESTGLCDVSFRIVEAPAKGQILTAQIELLESGRIVAEWALPWDKLVKGWVRLSLARALGTDAQTPVLRLAWDGADPLKLAASFAHPDPRFRAADDTGMLAMYTWKYIPGAAPLLAPDGIAASRTGMTDHWSIGSQSLRDAVNMNADPGSLEFTDWMGGLAVRPTAAQPGVARLNAVAHPGVVHLTGGIKTEAGEGPDVEYAYALAPTATRPRAAGHVPEFAPDMTSDWLRLPTASWSELHLFLKAPLTQTCDLYLLSRIPEGVAAQGPANAYFYKLLGHARPSREGDLDVG